MLCLEQLSPSNEVSLHIPNLDPDDFGDLREVDIEVFRFLVKCWRDPSIRLLSASEVGKGALRLHPDTVIQCLIELRARGFIEPRLVNTSESDGPADLPSSPGRPLEAASGT